MSDTQNNQNDQDEWNEEEDGPRNDDWIHLAYERQAGDNPWANR